jgi:hypothetical protein
MERKTRKVGNTGQQRGDAPIQELDGKLRKFAERNAISLVTARALFAQLGLGSRPSLP